MSYRQVLKKTTFDQFWKLFRIWLFYHMYIFRTRIHSAYIHWVMAPGRGRGPGDKILSEIYFWLPSAYGLVLMMSFGQFEHCETEDAYWLKGPSVVCTAGLLIANLLCLLPSQGNKNRGRESPTRSTKHSALPDHPFQIFYFLWFKLLGKFSELGLAEIRDDINESPQTTWWYAVRKGASHTSPDYLDLSGSRNLRMRLCDISAIHWLKLL